MTLDGRSRMRLIGAVLGISMLVTPVMMLDQFSNAVAKRFQTLDDISHDNSYNSRLLFYQWFLPTALDNIAGQGLGSTGLGTKLSSDSTAAANGAVFDSGVMEVPYVMGWPGTLLYVGGILTLLWRSFKATRKQPNDRFAICGFGVSVAILMMMLMVNTLVGFTGILFFIGVMMPCIGLRYSRSKRAAKSPPRAVRSDADDAAARGARTAGPRVAMRSGMPPVSRIAGGAS
jgi:O-antigen ligase